MNFIKVFPSDPYSKESACNTGDLGLIPGSGRSLTQEGNTQIPQEENGCPLECSCLDRRARWTWGYKELDTTERLTHT